MIAPHFSVCDSEDIDGNKGAVLWDDATDGPVSMLTDADVKHLARTSLAALPAPDRMALLRQACADAGLLAIDQKDAQLVHFPNAQGAAPSMPLRGEPREVR